MIYKRSGRRVAIPNMSDERLCSTCKNFDDWYDTHCHANDIYLDDWSEEDLKRDSERMRSTFNLSKRCWFYDPIK